MPATVKIYQFYGSSGASSADAEANGVRFKLADDASTDATNPVVVPASGTTYSYPRNLRLVLTSQSTNTTSIANLRFYTTGGNTLGSGLSILAKASSAYVPSPGGSGQAQATALAGAVDAFTNYPNASATLPLGGSCNPSTLAAGSAFGDFVVLQASVASTAGAGTSNAATLNFAYDEA